MRRAIVLALALAGCDGPAPGPPPFVPVLPDAAAVGTLRGEVLYEGPAPAMKKVGMGSSPECAMLNRQEVTDQSILVQGGRLRNAFVHLKSGLDPRYKFPIPAEEHVIGNEKCLYTPRVSGARTWQKIKLLNKDPTQHNFRSEQWSKTLSSEGQTAIVWFEKAQLTPLKCDLHNWMIGWLHVLDHPYFAVTGDDGRFEIQGVPPGEYTLEAWHETLGTQAATVKLEPKGTAEARLTFKR